MCINFSQSRSTNEFGSVKPLTLKENQDIVFDQLINFLKKNNFYCIDGNKDYFEIFSRKGNFEYTFSLSRTNNSCTTVNVLIYSDCMKIVPRKQLRLVIENIKNEFDVKVK